MIDRAISIVPLGDISHLILERLRSTLERSFRKNVKIIKWDEIFLQFPVPQYGERYNSRFILSMLEQAIPEDTEKLLAITDCDLYSPIFACFFGEAQLGGGCALVSICRLHQIYYDLPHDLNLFLSRCEKEVIHEIAHTYGLIHCKDKNCIMYPSHSIVDTDAKSIDFCPNCQASLDELKGSVE